MGRENLFVSHDYGESWQPVGGQPVQYRPTHMVLTGDGQLVLTYGDTPGPSQMGMEAYGNTIPVKANGQTFLPSDCQVAKRQDLAMQPYL